MKFVIDAVVLWPQDMSSEIRVIPFESSKINIIHGLSSTGKSSIIHIIDYVLGASKCQIPIGLIRNKVFWFGLKITMLGESWLVARKTPGAKQVSGDFYLEPFTGEYPEFLPVKLGTEAFKNKFNALVHMSDLPHSDEEKPSRLDSRSSYRDMAAFNFLPQHIVANPNALFFKTDAWLHKNRLIRAMPYALGIVDANYVMNEHRKDTAEKERDGLNKELLVLDRAKKRWGYDVDRMMNRCIELGMLSEDDLSEVLEEKIAKLQSVVKAYEENRLEETLKEPDRLHTNREFDAAVIREAQQQELVDNLAAEISGYSSLAINGQKFFAAINDERSHVIGLDWLKNSVAPEGNCVACGSSTSALPRVVEVLEQKVNQIATVAAVLQENPVVDRRLASLKRKMSNEQKTLYRLRREKNEILVQDKKLKDVIGQIYFMAGDISGLLSRIGKTSVDQSIFDRMSTLNSEVMHYENEMLKSNRYNREKTVSESLSGLIGEYVDRFPLEAPVDSEIKLDLKELTLRFDGPNDRKDYLWEVGSGANWMGYHIATFMAIHEYLAHEENQSLPPFSFLVIDQPSQVYFPSSQGGDNSLDQGFTGVAKHRASDVRATRRIFEMISQGLERAKFNFQVIVLEHAGPDIWKDVPHTHEVDNWDTKGDGLIPADWL
jgi:hypothetical protein